MITLILYIVGACLLAVGEAIALSKGTDSEMPITYYIRRTFYRFGPMGFLALLAIWIWLGAHFLIDRDGSLPF